MMITRADRFVGLLLALLLVLVVLIGIYPGWLLTMIETGSAFLPLQGTEG